MDRICRDKNSGRGPLLALISRLACLPVFCLLALAACRGGFREATEPSPELAERFRAEARVFSPLAGYLTGVPLSPGGFPMLSEESLRDGDVVSILRSDRRSLLVAFLTLGGFSHLGIVVREQGEAWVADVTLENCAGGRGACLRRHRLREWLADRDGAVTVLAAAHRLRHTNSVDPGRLKEALRRMEGGCVHFDMEFTRDNDTPDCRNLYCSEFVRDLLAEAGAVVAAPAIDPVVRAAGWRLYWNRDLPGRGGATAHAAMAEVRRLGLGSSIPADVLPPSLADLTPGLVPVAFALRPDARAHVGPGLETFARSRPAFLFLRALHGERTDIFLDRAFEAVGLDEPSRALVRPVVKAYRRGRRLAFDSPSLLIDLLASLAADQKPYMDFDAALALPRAEQAQASVQ